MDTNERLKQEKSRIDITNSVKSFTRYWWVYLVSFAFFITLAVIYVKVKAPVYDISAKIILNDNDDLGKSNLGGLGSLMASFSIGGAGGKYVEDEIVRMRSHSNELELIKRLRLNEQYSSKKEFMAQRITYFNDSPLMVYIPESILDTISVTSKFEIKVSPDGSKADIEVKQKKDVTYSRKGVALPADVRTPYGTFRVSTTSFFKPGKDDLNMRVIISSPNVTVKRLAKDIKARTPSKKSGLVLLSYKDVNTERGCAVLDGLVEIYNENSLADTRRQAQAAVDFIKNRLEKLYSELETSEQSIESYKRTNGIVDPEVEAEYIFKKKQLAESGVIEYETQASVLRMVIDFLKSESNRYSLIPFAADMPKEPLEEYNKLVMERLRLQENARGNNAAFKTLSAQIDAMRSNLISSLERQLAAANIAIADMKRSDASTSSRIADYPSMEKDLLSLYRDQKIKNQIYAYLLQKLEESELKLSRDITVGKTVDAAYPDTDPSSPKKSMVLIGAAFGSVAVAYAGLMLWMRLCSMMKAARIRKTKKD